MTTNPTEKTESTNDPKAMLEKKLIEEYLREKGYLMEDLKKMPAGLAEELMKEATRYATLKLEGISAGAHFVGEIHGGGSSRQ
jgi:hypothetical protein